MYDILSLGEILLRLSPPGETRLFSSHTLEENLGGAELNVVVGAAQLGMKTGLITKLPANMMGSYAQRIVESGSVSPEYIVYDHDDDARLGLYYYERGAYPRKPTAVYDRKGSSFCKITPDDFPNDIYSKTRCFHTTGITFGLGGQCRETAMELIKRFKAAGAKISFDVNYRANLWSGEEARQCIEQVLPYVDYFFCSEDTARLTFNKTGTLEEMMMSFADDYPMTAIFSTHRTVHSPRIHDFTSKIYDVKTESFISGKPYERIDVVDRIGSGDCYISGALYGMLSEGGCVQKACRFGNATAALKMTTAGDVWVSSLPEVERTIEEHYSEGEVSELNR